LGPRCILAAHDERILRALREPALIEVAVVGSRNARILLRRAYFQFRGKLIHQRLDRLKSRVRVGVLCIEIGDYPWVSAVA
jgi:hypothetical protein